jgi:hypothetical protein
LLGRRFPIRFTYHLRDSQGETLVRKVRHELLQISIAHIDPLPINLARPVHVPYDVPRDPHLFKPGNPLIDVGNNRLEEMTVSSDDFA